MNKSNSTLPISDYLTGDEKQFNPLKSRLVIYSFCIIFIIGYVMDLIFIKPSNMIFYTDILTILVSLSIIIAFYFQTIGISRVIKLQILLLLANIIVSHYFHPINSPTYVSAFLRNTIILFILVPIYGLFSGKKQIFTIGFVYLLLYGSALVRAKNPMLTSNAPILIFSSIMYFVGIYLVFDTIEKMHTYQIKLNQNLKTQKKQAEAQRNRIEHLNNELKSSNQKLTKTNLTKDKLFSIIGHDLRSPFNSILGFSGILIEKSEKNEIVESKKYSGIINSQAEKALILLDNLLEWAKTQTGQIIYKPEKINLGSIIKEVLEIANSSAKIKNITLNYNQSDEIEVYADRRMLMVVIRNLISNAIKFTKTGGHINIFAISGQNNIEITVSDNGVGMKEETLKKLFDISTNTTSLGTANEKGSGLGLVLCKEFVEKHGGKIWVESEEGKGSDFKFHLPTSTTTIN